MRSRLCWLKPTVKFPCLSVCVLLTLLSIATQPVVAQAPPPLNFANNYFVRGDFTVAGAQGMLSNFTNISGNSYAVGTITVPDTNPGIKPSVITGNGSNAVPLNAEVIAAVLYWQTVEKIGVTPGQVGSGQNGFFRPVISGGPAAPGYAISGVSLSSGTNTVSWSAGGCTSGSTGKIIRTYRANVLGALPRDASGNVSPNVKYEIRVPGTPSTTPIAVGASLVLIYRILDPKIPLNSIVIYDGDYAPSNTSLITSQTMQGFYDAAHNAISRLAHIVGNGKSNKFETVYLNNQALPSFYPKGQPPFPGYYGSWDNTVWTFDPTKKYVNLSNPVTEDSASVTTQVVPSSSMQGCVSWGASIISTTVKNTDGDGLVDAWKKAPRGYPNPGYCDAAVNEGVCTPGSASWVDLPGAVLGTAQSPHPDVFIQLDYMCSQVNADGSCTTGDGTNYSFDPSLHIDPNDHNYNAVQKIVNAYGSHGITLHVNPPSANQSNFHAMPEPFCQDDTTTTPASLCPFPNSPGTSANLGVVTWPGGFDFLKSQLIDSNDPTNLTDCAASNPPAYCIPRFQPAAAPSKHYLLLGHAAGQAEWALVGGSLTNVSQSGNTVTQAGNTVTFTTSSPVGVLDSIGTDLNGNNIPDPTCPNGRVTVIGASTNPDLNGTFCISNPTNPLGNTFSILIGGSAMKASYKLASDPNLAVAPGFTGTASGVSDVGGANSYISLGLWGNPAFSGQNAQTSPASDGQKLSTIAGTIMHELGHGNGLAHGGPAALVAQNKQSIQSVTTNCKPNYMSAMSHSRQVDFAPDYSGGVLGELNEATKTGGLNIADITSWYVAWPLKDSSGHTIVDTNGNPIGSPAKAFCSGLPLPLSAPPSMMRVTGPANTFSFLNVANPDINFDDLIEDLLGADDWHNLDLAQLDATGADTNSSGQRFNGGGQRFNGGGQRFNGGGQRFNGGGQRFNGGGQRFNGGGEIDTATVNSITRPPQNLRITAEEASPRYVDLQWDAPTFGSIGAYRVYRSADAGQTFKLIATLPSTQFTYQDTNGAGAGPACLPSGRYEYFVTAVLAGTFVGPLPQPTEGQESVPSNTVAGEPNIPDPLTGCYTVTNFSSPASAIQGQIVPITFTLFDDFYSTTNPVNRPAAVTSLVAIGPVGSDVACTAVTPGRVTLVTNGVAASLGASTFPAPSGGVFTFNLDTDVIPFCAGAYTFELDLDSGQKLTTTSALQLSIDVTDSDSTPHIATVSLPKAIAGVLYSYAIPEHGGTAPFTWSLATGSTAPPGLTLSTSGTLTGTATDVGTYSFTVTVVDSLGNAGSQALSILIVAPVAQINQPVAPEILLLGGAAPTLTVNGEGFYAGSQVLWNGSALVTNFVNTGQLTVTVPASNVASLGAASISVANKNSANSNVDFFQITDPVTAVSLSRTDEATGVNPNAIITADFNGDHKLDLAIANGGSNTVSILLGNGDGTFTISETPGTGGVPHSLAVGDFNQDGKLDVAVANSSDGNVSVLLGNGDGTFQAQATYAVGIGPVSVIAADFDRDGKLDLAVTNQNDATVSILLGNGNGTFQLPAASYPAVPANAAIKDVASVSVGDFNGDNKLDLAVTNPSNDTVSVLLGNGEGTFQAPVTYSTGNSGDHPAAVSAVDVNGDGKLDLAVTNLNAKNVVILLGNGNGTFTATAPVSATSGAQTGPSAIATGDFNADGKIDLAITNQRNNTVSILFGNGNGVFQAPVESATGDFAEGVAVGDFIGNGRLDLAVADHGAGSVSIMLQRPQAPMNLAAGATVGQATLSWSASLSTTVTGYNVYRSTTAGGGNTGYTKIVSLGKVVSYTDGTVSAGTMYYYVVTAVDPNSLESVNSNEASVTPPAPATSLTANTPTAGQVALTWTGSSTASVTGYNVYRGTTAGGPYTQIASQVAMTSYTDSLGTGTTTYYYVVTAVGPGNVESVYSNEASATP
jgi:fibronectin type 3 domain-containing protein